MKRHGIVLGPLEITADLQAANDVAATRQLAVALDGVNQCRRCQRGQGCGAMLAGTRSDRNGITIPCRSAMNVNRGQRVVVEIDEQGSYWLLLVSGAYGLPLLGMLLGTGLANVVLDINSSASGFAELGVIVAAVAGFLAGHCSWLRVSRQAMRCTERTLCLQSARIVGLQSCSKRDH